MATLDSCRRRHTALGGLVMSYLQVVANKKPQGIGGQRGFSRAESLFVAKGKQQIRGKLAHNRRLEGDKRLGQG